MRYHFNKPKQYFANYGQIYRCNHPVYSACTLYLISGRGLAIIQQRYDKATKATWWTSIDISMNDVLYLNPGFKSYFDKHARACKDGLYPTVTIRQIMWALKLKPLKREPWETVFDHCPI